MAEVVDFDSFFFALHGHHPFPWQRRLAVEVDEGSGWPEEIGVPTGLGKTSCLDIAVWALARNAARTDVARTVPTRIWWVVNRRLLVDATTDHAEALARRLSEEHQTAGPIGEVADALASLSPTSTPLEVVRLRGGAAAGRPCDPAQPAVILSTIPMYGSRLLFRGYGSSRSMRPIDAALAGTDSLVLVDEAHLAHHLVKLSAPLAKCDRIEQSVLAEPRSRPTIVALTATGSAASERRLDLDGEDFAHPVVQHRIRASKPVELRRATGKADKALADAASDLLGAAQGPTSLVVFVNTPADARKVFSRLTKLAGGTRPKIDACIELLTGRVREREAALIRERVLTRVGADSEAKLSKHLVVVATQTLEVGADLDFELFVTESCGVRALIQRLGRFNRRGTKPNPQGVYCHTDPAKTGWPVYGHEPGVVWERLSAAGTAVVDLCPQVVSDVLGTPSDDDGPAPEVLPALLWEWAKTTVPPAGEAPVEPYFSGLQDPDRRVSIVWRASIPQQPEHGAPGAAVDRLWPAVRDQEAVEVPIGEARAVLSDTELHRLDADRRGVEHVLADDLRPGDVIVLPVDAGFYDRHGWAPDQPGVMVADVSLLDAGLPIDSVALKRLFGDSESEPWGVLVEAVLDREADDDEINERSAELLGQIKAAAPTAWSEAEWNDLLAALGAEVVTPFGEVARIPLNRQGREVRIDDLDEMSLVDDVDLHTHGQEVGGRARAIGKLLGLAPDIVEALGIAGDAHDSGKADPRFQRWLDPDRQADTLLAKSSSPPHRWRADRVAAGWPAGGRHEELSRRLVDAWLEADHPHKRLIEHLVVSHHGFGRPIVIPVPDATPSLLTAELGGQEVTVAADLQVGDWEQPGRFRELCETYGFWGLALLEAIVRQADHAASRGDNPVEVT